MPKNGWCEGVVFSTKEKINKSIIGMLRIEEETAKVKANNVYTFKHKYVHVIMGILILRIKSQSYRNFCSDRSMEV